MEVEMKGAIFSDCRKYRYQLWRIWDGDKPLLMVIGLNPSTANEGADDPTIKRLRQIAKINGYGGFYMTNLFAYIATDPDQLFKCDDPLGNNNDHLLGVAELCNDILFAWGNFKVHGRDVEVKKMFPKAFTLHINKNGSPKHPLYCRSDSWLIPYSHNL